jgi:hypothetical protein
LSARAKFLFNTDFGPVKRHRRRSRLKTMRLRWRPAEQRGFQRGLTAAEARPAPGGTPYRRRL